MSALAHSGGFATGGQPVSPEGPGLVALAPGRVLAHLAPIPDPRSQYPFLRLGAEAQEAGRAALSE